MTEKERYDHLAMMFGSLGKAFLAYAVILSAIMMILLTDAVWRFVTWNWTFRDVFGEAIALLFMYVMIRSLLAMRRYMRSYADK